MSRKHEANNTKNLRPLVALALAAAVALVALISLGFGSSALSEAKAASDTGARGNKSATHKDGIASQSSPGTLPPLPSAESPSSHSSPGTLPPLPSAESPSSHSSPGTLPPPSSAASSISPGSLSDE